MMTLPQTIVLACDTHEGEQFRDYLISLGIDASIGQDTGDHVDGYWTAKNIPASEIMRQLWDNYCSSINPLTLGELKQDEKDSLHYRP
jgi:hypothetical protein